MKMAKFSFLKRRSKLLFLFSGSFQGTRFVLGEEKERRRKRGERERERRKWQTSNCLKLWKEGILKRFIFFSFFILIISLVMILLSLCVLSCDIDLKVLRKERVYSFDESLWKRRLKDDHFVDWKWCFPQESCCWGFFLFLFPFVGRRKFWWLIVSFVVVFEGWIRSIYYCLWIWESWNCSISFWERLFSSANFGKSSFFSHHIFSYWLLCVFNSILLLLFLFDCSKNQRRLHYLQFVKKDILKLPNFWLKKEPQ